MLFKLNLLFLIYIFTGEKTNQLISTTREIYRPVATRGSVLYFAIASLAAIDSMYQYSLQFFQKLYNTRIEQAEQPNVKELMIDEEKDSDIVKKEKQDQTVLARLEILIEDITWTMYVSVCRGLFEKDKMVRSKLIIEM